MIGTAEDEYNAYLYPTEELKHKCNYFAEELNKCLPGGNPTQKAKYSSWSLAYREFESKELDPARLDYLASIGKTCGTVFEAMSGKLTRMPEPDDKARKNIGKKDKAKLEELSQQFQDTYGAQFNETGRSETTNN